MFILHIHINQTYQQYCIIVFLLGYLSPQKMKSNFLEIMSRISKRKSQNKLQSSAHKCYFCKGVGLDGGLHLPLKTPNTAPAKPS